MGGGGGSTDIDLASPQEQKKTIKSFYGFQENQLDRFGRKQPLLAAAQKGALGFWDQLPGLLSQITGYQGQLGGYESKLGSWLGEIEPTIQNKGALSPEAQRLASQEARAAASASGTTHDPSALVNEVLNREQYRQQRFNTALAQGQGILGQQAGLVGQGAGLTQATQGLQTGGLNQLLGVESGKTSNFATVTNPILSYLSNLFGQQAQAQIAQAQINAQQNASGKAGTSSAIGGGLSAFGSIAGAAL